MRKITAFVLVCLLIVTAALTGCGKVEFIHYNSVSITGEDGTKDIEGSYTKDMSIDDFEAQTGLPIRQSLPEAYQSASLSVQALYDKDDKIINLTLEIHNEDGSSAATVSVYSPDIWSTESYSPIGGKYDGGSDDVQVSKIGMMTTLFYRYDDSNEQKLGHDMYVAHFSVNSLYIYVESGAMSQDDFELFTAALIAVGNV